MVDVDVGVGEVVVVGVVAGCCGGRVAECIVLVVSNMSSLVAVEFGTGLLGVGIGSVAVLLVSCAG